jgi:hypothetical protein
VCYNTEMNQKPTITLSEDARAIAAKRAREEGFDSIEAYIDALIEDDRQTGQMQAWMRVRLEEGLASPSAGELTEEKVKQLVGEGIARTAR